MQFVSQYRCWCLKVKSKLFFWEFSESHFVLLVLLLWYTFCLDTGQYGSLGSKTYSPETVEASLQRYIDVFESLRRTNTVLRLSVQLRRQSDDGATGRLRRSQSYSGGKETSHRLVCYALLDIESTGEVCVCIRAGSVRYQYLIIVIK